MTASSLQLRAPTRDLGTVMKEVDENMAAFLGRPVEENRSDQKQDRLDDDHQILAADDFNWLLPGHDQAQDQLSYTSNGSASPRLQPTISDSPAAVMSSSAPKLSARSNSRATIAPSSLKSTAAKAKPHFSARATVAASAQPVRRFSTPTRKPATPPAISSGSFQGRKAVATKNPIRSPVNSENRNASRPVSATRGRPSAGASSNVKPRRQSCSPARFPARTTSDQKPGNVMATRSRAESNDVNPVLIGTKMVERVVNMRKLAPPKEEQRCLSSLDLPKKASKENSGFGRSLSNKSLEMAIRHMDIRRSIPYDLRPAAASSSSRGTQSSSSKSSAVSFTGSPPLSSTDSSKSINSLKPSSAKAN